MKKKSILFSMMVFLFAISLNAQIEVEQEAVTEETDSPTQGFFVKGGSQKIDAFECYTFKDLILSFDLKEEHFNCDGIDIEIFVGKKMYNRGKGWKQEEFTELFGGKKYAYFKVFSSEDMEETSDWRFNRSLLQHTNTKRDLDGTKMVVKVFCGKITGEEEISEVIFDKVVTRKKKIWKWDVSTTFSIELKNRIYIKPFKFLISEYPKEPVATGDCYE